mgnify:CR=1 FL=1
MMRDNNYDISIIVPVYNSEKYLKKCLDSIIHQTKKNIEIVVVNDGSTDSSLQILNEYKKYKNFKIISQLNQGVIGARITGYQNATGKYIGWVDNDDFIEPDMFEKLYALAQIHDADIVICNYSFYPHPVKTKKKWFKEYYGVNDWNFIDKNGLLWNKIVRKEFLNKIHFEKLLKNLGEGSYTIAMLNTSKIVTLNHELYHYRVGQDSVSGSFSEKVDYYYNIMIQEQKKFDLIKKMNLSTELKSYFKYYFLRSKLILLLVAAFNKNRQLYLEIKTELVHSSFFSKKYKKFLKSDFSVFQIMFFKLIVRHSYFFTALISRIVMR